PIARRGRSLRAWTSARSSAVTSSVREPAEDRPSRRRRQADPPCAGPRLQPAARTAQAARRQAVRSVLVAAFAVHVAVLDLDLLGLAHRSEERRVGKGWGCTGA